MRGAIRARGTCDRCGGKWRDEYARGRQVAIVCSDCGASAPAVYVDARGFRDRTGNVGRIYTDEHDQPLAYPAASRLLEAIRADYDRNPKGFVVAKWSRRQRKGYLIEDAGKRWIEFLDETRSKTYADHQEIFLRHIQARLGNMDVREIRAGAVEDLYRDLLGTFKPKTVQSILFALRTLLNWMKRREELERVPAFPDVKVPTRIVRWITRPEQDKVVVAGEERYRLPFRILIETGIRPGEAVALQAGDVQEGGIVVCKAIGDRGKVKETKAGKVQFKRVSDALFVDLVAAGRGKLPGAFLFVQGDGRPMSVGVLSVAWRRAATAAKVDAPLYEGTRHSLAVRIRQEKERAIGEAVADALGNTAVVAMRNYAPCLPRVHGVKAHRDK
jgi:integrase